VFLNNNGTLMAMGDDTFGQCGTGDSVERSASAPFYEVRHRKPVKVVMPAVRENVPVKVKKIVCGFRHSLAITEDG